jgi:ribosomal protein L7/L12
MTMIQLQKDNGELKARVARLERAIAFLLNELKLTYVDKPDEAPFADVAALVHSGNKVEAIRIYREKTGATLGEAQDFISKL